MKNPIKKALCIFSATILLGIGTYSGKRWVDAQINNAIVQYEEKDKQWTEQKFEAKVSPTQLANVLNSSYRILNYAFFKAADGTLIPDPIVYAGSAMQFEGGYFLTARHLTTPGKTIPITAQHPEHGEVKYDHSEYHISDEAPPQKLDEAGKPIKPQKKCELEEIITSSNEEIDYTLLKIKDDVSLPYYSQGLNIPSKIEEGMETLSVGFPLQRGRHVRRGSIMQAKSDLGEHYVTYENEIKPGDSGGPLFVIKDGNLKLAALTSQRHETMIGMTMLGPVTQDTNIDYGLKISSIVKDMEDQLKLGKLDKKDEEEVKNFLKLNQREYPDPPRLDSGGPLFVIKDGNLKLAAFKHH